MGVEIRDMRIPQSAAAIKRQIQPGQVYEVTNHYITRPDHPCYGTRRETIAVVNTSSFRFEGTQWGIPWPKAAQMEMDAGGAIKLFGGGAAQSPTELFMTLTPVS